MAALDGQPATQSMRTAGLFDKFFPLDDQPVFLWPQGIWVEISTEPEPQATGINTSSCGDPYDACDEMSNPPSPVLTKRCRAAGELAAEQAARMLVTRLLRYCNGRQWPLDEPLLSNLSPVCALNPLSRLLTCIIAPFVWFSPTR
jgi:hypothetical protein